jgi:hypothetical protein
VSSLEDLVADNSGTDLERGALVVRVGPILIFNITQVVGPDRQGTGTGRATEITI